MSPGRRGTRSWPRPRASLFRSARVQPTATEASRILPDVLHVRCKNAEMLQEHRRYGLRRRRGHLMYLLDTQAKRVVGVDFDATLIDHAIIFLRSSGIQQTSLACDCALREMTNGEDT